MSGESPDHPIGEGEDERQSNSEECSARGRSLTRPVNGPRIPRLRLVPARRILHNPISTHFIDLTGDARDGERPTPPPLVYQNGARYALEKTATANDRTGDMTATCKKLEGDPKRQHLIPIKEDSDAEIAVKEVNQYIFSKTKEHAQELEKQIPQLLRQAAGREDAIEASATHSRARLLQMRRKCSRQRWQCCLQLRRKSASIEVSMD